jgi:lambda repressor-like predicted transcriptional regulator
MYGTRMNIPSPQTDNAADVEIANRIMNALIVKGMNLEALSEATDIKIHTLRRSLHQSRIDCRSFNFSEFRRIAAALKVPTSALLPDEFAGRIAA